MHPILFEFGPLKVGSYGTAVLLSGLTAYLLVPRYARRYGVDPEIARSLFVAVFVAGWVGSRIALLGMRFSDIVADPRVGFWFLRQAGLWYGSVAGGLLVAVVLTRRWKLDLWRMFDVLAVPALLGGGLGRLGCLMSGCCYGKPTNVPWAIRFDDPLAHRMHAGLPWEPVHPTQLYELGVVLVLAVAVDRFGDRPHAPGQAGLLWILLYGAVRIAIEVFRGDQVRGTLLGPLSTSQTIGIASIVVAALLFRMRGRRESPA